MTWLGFCYCNYFCQYRPEAFDYFHVEYATKFSCLLTLSEDDDYAYLKYFKKGFRSSITPNIVTLEDFEDFSEDPKRELLTLRQDAKKISHHKKKLKIL